ncbi:DUF58 domain-containing protein [Listeria aquatica]|uniref:DUF58 domain-containing protein n=1 Tax=Listeria aquatica TaxID=1494960 RepID=A0A841ZLI8_9LIST|nr:DUF58 domain-containing protein [Listeria aquatica]MBC1520124.1 DUF58 domain-containing protein [Listeria aquatica]
MNKLRPLFLASKWFGLALLFVSLIVYALFQGDHSSWFLTYFFGFILLFVLIFSIYRLKNWQLIRKFDKQEYFSGDAINLRLSLTRKSHFPVCYLLVKQPLPGSLHAQHVLRELTFPFFKRKLMLPFETVQAKRGIHEFPPLELRTSDPLGLIERSIRMGEPKTLIVYPTYFPEIANKLSEASPEHGKNATHWTIKKNENLHGLREYNPGDRVASIDWKTTAKTGTMMTREFENSAKSRMSVGFFGSPDPDFEIALSAAYSFVRKMVEENGELRVALFGSPSETFDFNQGKKHLSELSHAFAKIKPQEPAVLLPELQEELAQSEHLLLFTSTTNEALLREVHKWGENKVTLVALQESGAKHPQIIYLSKMELSHSKGGI